MYNSIASLYTYILIYILVYLFRLISNACQRRKNTKANKQATMRLRNKTESSSTTDTITTDTAADTGTAGTIGTVESI